MKAIASTVFSKQNLLPVLLDSAALLFIYFLPSISHITNLPVYLIEPMRLMLVLAIVHSKIPNAYILAFTMPLFSFMVSGHPGFPKLFLIMTELSLSVFFFYFLEKRTGSIFLSVLFSIVLSKIIYYVLKLSLISLVLMNTELVSTPLYIQAITTLVFSFYAFLFYKKQKTL